MDSPTKLKLRSSHYGYQDQVFKLRSSHYGYQDQVFKFNNIQQKSFDIVKMWKVVFIITKLVNYVYHFSSVFENINSNFLRNCSFRKIINIYNN